MTTIPQVVTVQLGQCGNQLGCAFFQSLWQNSVQGGAEIIPKFTIKSPPKPSTSRSAPSSNRNNAAAMIEPPDALDIADIDLLPTTWFRFGASSRMPIARSVLVDMEPRVIKATIEEANAQGKWKYDERRQFAVSSGAANNWAYGYNHYGPRVCEAVEELIRKEVEICDRLGGMLILQSLAGGTGSGVGSFITDRLRDAYPSTALLNSVVWPYTSGEVIVQNYNSVLSLSRLYESSNGVLCFFNDQAATVCKKLLNIERPEFSDINKVIAGEIANLGLPCKINNNQGRKFKLMSDVVSSICPSPCFKFLSARTVPQVSLRSKEFSANLWEALIKRLFQMQITGSNMEEGMNWGIRPHMKDRVVKSLSNLVIARGENWETSFSPEWTKAFHDSNVVATQINDQPFTLCGNNNRFANNDKTAMILSNSQSIISPLDRVLASVAEMRGAGAFLHQYQRFGADDAFFESSVEILEQALFDYKNI